MAEEKRYYWIKLKDSFMTSDAVDFLMSQKNGSDYVVLYQMLCLKTVNTNGELVRQIGEVIIPFDIDKIQRDCKYFSYDTVAVAMELFKKLGLIYEQENGYLKIAKFDELVGSESKWAKYKRDKKELPDSPKKLENFQSSSNETPKLSPTDFQQESRDKSIDNRDKILDIRDEEIISKESESEKKDTLAHGRNNNVILTDEEYAEFKKDRPHDYQQLIDELSEKVVIDDKYKHNHSAWLRIFANTKDRQKKNSSASSSEKTPSYDIDLIMQRSRNLDPTKTKKGE